MRRSRLAWIEMVGLLPCSLILGKFLLVGLLGMMLVIVAWAMGPHPAGGWRTQPGGIALFLLLMIGGLAGLTGLWVAVLLGAERMRRSAWRRWGVLLCLVGGLGAAAYWLRWMGVQARAVPSGSWGWMFWSVLLVPPIAVGTRQIYLLLRHA